MKNMKKKLTVKDILTRKNSNKKITMLTAYDAAMASILDNVGVDVILVGDSLGMVVLGLDSTAGVTMEDMLHHTKAVSRGTDKALIVADLPFGAYLVTPADTVRNGYRLLQEGGADAVKLEGGFNAVSDVEALVRAGIPVMGHLGLTPQTAGILGGFKVQGKDLQAGQKIVAEAVALSEAGVFAIVLECVPSSLAEVISKKVPVPVIGIGAGKGCDGQVLVTHDMLGMFAKFTPKFVKKYLDLSAQMEKAVSSYCAEVEAGYFPDSEYEFSSKTDFSVLLDDGTKNK